MKKKILYFFVFILLIDCKMQGAQAQQKQYYIINMLANKACPMGVSLGGKNPVDVFYEQKALAFDKGDFPLRITPGCKYYTVPPEKASLEIPDPAHSGPICISVGPGGRLNPQDPNSPEIMTYATSYIPCPPPGY